MNHHRQYDKDFWLAENQCLVTSKKQFDEHYALTKEIIEIWGKAEAIEEVRVKNIKQLYESYFNKTLIMSEHSKKLLQVIQKTNEEEISSKIYDHKNMLSDEEIKACRNLCELLNVKDDVLDMNTIEFKDFIKNIKIRDAPQTTFIVKEGILKRDPGIMKSWRDVI